MNILVVCGGFFPTNSPRAHRSTELVKQLVREGHKVTVLTSIFDKSQVDFSIEKGFNIISFGLRRFNPLPRNKIRILDIISRGINRLTNLLIDFPDIEYYFLVRKKIKQLEGFDLLISVAAPHSIHWAVNSRINPNIARVWIADCGDPFYANQVDTYRRPIYFKWIEQSWSRRADIITIPKYEYMYSFLEEFHPKIKEIPQGFNLEEQRKQLDVYVKNKVPTFMYAGSFVPIHRDPTLFLEALVNLDQDFRFHIHTRQTHYVTPFLKRAKGRIIIGEFLDRPSLLAKLSRMDFNINFMYDPYKYAPGKMADVLIAGRPIFNVDYNIDHAALDEFMHGNYTKRFNLFDVNRFDIETVTKQFIQYYNEARLSK